MLSTKREQINATYRKKYIEYSKYFLWISRIYSLFKVENLINKCNEKVCNYLNQNL